jgi:lipoic acid synthetase
MSLAKPPWLRKKLPLGERAKKIEQDLMANRLHTICQEALCPNQGECFSKGVATFLIMGNMCTRNCRFCAVSSGKPEKLDPREPERLAQEIHDLHLRFVVVTSVTRDDLLDGGANHFAKVIRAIRKKCKGIGIEVLIPDFQGSSLDLGIVVNAAPEVLNHNVETVPRLYPNVRPQANYTRSLELLKKAKHIGQALITKSGLMVGLGEEKDEVIQVMADLQNSDCDILTIGQYLCPSPSHHPVVEYVRPEVFEEYEKIGLEMGFKGVASSPFVRSSFIAETFYNKAIKGLHNKPCSARH